jgi:hypothetical protein
MESERIDLIFLSAASIKGFFPILPYGSSRFHPAQGGVG